MENFCESPLWDSNLTWYTTSPYFTPCFEVTVLTLCPLAFVILFGIIDILNISKSKFQKKSLLSSFDPLIVLKTCLTLFLIVLQLIQIIRFTVKFDNLSTEYFTIDYLSTSLFILGYVIVLVLSILTNYHLVASSGVQFFFWLLTTLTQAIIFRTALKNYHNDETKKGIIYLMRLISFPAIVLRFIVEWFDENSFTLTNTNLLLGNPSPEKTSNFFSKLFIQWFDKLAWTGYRRTLTKNDLWDLNHENTSNILYSKFAKYYTKEKVKSSEKNLKGSKESVSVAGIFIPLCKTFGLTYAVGVSMKITSDMLAFVQPVMLSYLVSHVANPDMEPTWKGFLYVATICIAALSQTLIIASSNKRSFLTGMRIRTALSNAVFRKALVISNASKKGKEKSRNNSYF